jgi:hypothetical protein
MQVGWCAHLRQNKFVGCLYIHGGKLSCMLLENTLNQALLSHAVEPSAKRPKHGTELQGE